MASTDTIATKASAGRATSTTGVWVGTTIDMTTVVEPNVDTLLLDDQTHHMQNMHQ